MRGGGGGGGGSASHIDQGRRSRFIACVLLRPGFAQKLSYSKTEYIHWKIKTLPRCEKLEEIG